MITVAAVVVCLVEDDPAPVLATLGFADEIHVVTDSKSVANAVAAVGCAAHVIPRPACIEEVGQLLLKVAATDWTLFVDPDERVRADNGLLRDTLARSGHDVAALDVAFSLALFGEELTATFKGLRKTKLLRAGRCVWPAEIHSLPQPIDPAARIERIEAAALTIASDLGQDLPQRLVRHARWADVEARDRERPVDIDRLLGALTFPLIEYLADRGGFDDGIAGLANALLHVAKEIQRALFEASHGGFTHMRAADRRRVAKLLEIVREP